MILWRILHTNPTLTGREIPTHGHDQDIAPLALHAHLVGVMIGETIADAMIGGTIVVAMTGEMVVDVDGKREPNWTIGIHVDTFIEDEITIRNLGTSSSNNLLLHSH
ncbi:MAG TPA: hypothetical protein VE710_15970 [Candidatus Bathyarchaeia archaeon]|nr:hypothetical protein [Candidatus Bathyarchaeia archaeon]